MNIDVPIAELNHGDEPIGHTLDVLPFAAGIKVVNRDTPNIAFDNRTDLEGSLSFVFNTCGSIHQLLEQRSPVRQSYTF